jgi:uncharacterized protein (DUF2267 family)
LLRGMYYEGWNPPKVPVKISREEFLQRISTEFGYEVEGTTEHLVQVVLQSLRRFVTEGEWQDVKSIVPKDLAEVLS